MDTTKTPPEITLRNFESTDLDTFYEMTRDKAIQDYFMDLADEEYMVKARFEGINSDIPLMQYWGIFQKEDLVGFACLKGNPTIFRTLEEKAKGPAVDDPDDPEYLTFETKEEKEKREWREKLIAPFSIDIAVHGDHRGKGIGKAAIQWVSGYAAAAGIDEVYFEIRKDNEASKKMLAGHSLSLAADSTEHSGHDLYRMQINFDAPSPEKLREELALLKDTPDKQRLFNHWRNTVINIPELAPHREIIMDLYQAILDKEAILDIDVKWSSCHHTSELFEEKILVSLQKREDPTTLIWSIAHEYGHLLQEEARGNERKLYTKEKYLREADAWDKAEAWLKDKPFYMYNWSSFIRFRNNRLEKYLPDNVFNASPDPDTV